MFGKRLRQLRKNKGISQYELADRLNLSRGQLGNYEQGKRQPDYETLLKISEFFGCTTDYLLGKSDTPLLTEFQDQRLNDETEKYLEILESLPDDKRKELEERILAFAQMIANANKKDS